MTTGNGDLWPDDLEDEPTPASPGDLPAPGLNFGTFLENIVKLSGYWAQIVEKAPPLIQGSRVQQWIAKNKVAAAADGVRELNPPQEAQVQEQTNGTEEAAQRLQDPNIAWSHLQQLLLYVTTQLPEGVTVREGLAILQGLQGKEGELGPMLEKAGLMDSPLSDVLLGAPIVKKEAIVGYLSRIGEVFTNAQQQAGGQTVRHRRPARERKDSAGEAHSP